MRDLRSKEVEGFQHRGCNIKKKKKKPQAAKREAEKILLGSIGRGGKA